MAAAEGGGAPPAWLDGELLGRALQPAPKPDDPPTRPQLRVVRFTTERLSRRGITAWAVQAFTLQGCIARDRAVVAKSPASPAEVAVYTQVLPALTSPPAPELIYAEGAVLLTEDLRPLGFTPLHTLLTMQDVLPAARALGRLHGASAAALAEAPLLAAAVPRRLEVLDAREELAGALGSVARAIATWPLPDAAFYSQQVGRLSDVLPAMRDLLEPVGETMVLLHGQLEERHILLRHAAATTGPTTAGLTAADVRFVDFGRSRWGRPGHDLLHLTADLADEQAVGEVVREYREAFAGHGGSDGRVDAPEPQGLRAQLRECCVFEVMDALRSAATRTDADADLMRRLPLFRARGWLDF